MTRLDDWRAQQHEDQALPADVRMSMFLAQLNPSTVALDSGAHLTPQEVGLIGGYSIHLGRTA